MTVFKAYETAIREAEGLRDGYAIPIFSAKGGYELGAPVTDNVVFTKAEEIGRVYGWNVDSFDFGAETRRISRNRRINEVLSLYLDEWFAEFCDINKVADE
jgi:hypothetical protein